MIVDAVDLALYLRDVGLASNPNFQYLVDLANGVVEDEWSEPVDPAPPAVIAVVCEVVRRAWDNPKGLSSWTRSIDDASRTERLSDQRARAGLYLTDEDYAVLHAVAVPVTRKARSIQMTVPDWFGAHRC